VSNPWKGKRIEQERPSKKGSNVPRQGTLWRKTPLDQKEICQQESQKKKLQVRGYREAYPCIAM
jgi:hypothetical protein